MELVRCVVRYVLGGSALALVACGGGGDGDEESMSSAQEPLSHDEACRESCEAQFATGCRGAFPVADCTEACKSLPETLGGCEAEDTALNTCMAEAPLFCDVNGNAAVSYDDCGPEIDAFDDCLGML